MDEDNKNLNIKLEKNFFEEAILRYKKDAQFISYALQGMFKAVMEKLYKEKFTCRETQCAFNGGKCCEFVVEVRK